MIRGIIFDFDGLVLDTESPDYYAWSAVYRDYDAHLPLEEWLKCVGTSADAFDPCLYLEQTIGRPVERERLRAVVREQRLAVIAQQPALPGVVAALDEARRLGLRLGMASSSSRAWVSGHLTRLGLLDYFEVLRCAEDVEAVKPDPALYRAALEGLGLAPHEAIAIEDSAHGVLAAKRAGLYCVAVPNVVTRGLDFSQADRVLKSLDEVPLAELVRGANGASG